MKLAIVTLALVALIGCAPIVDSPQLRATFDSNALTVLPVPDKPRSLPGRLRVTIATFTPTPLPDWSYSVTPTATKGTP